jgi:hypothetical protein
MVTHDNPASDALVSTVNVTPVTPAGSRCDNVNADPVTTGDGIH